MRLLLCFLVSSCCAYVPEPQVDPRPVDYCDSKKMAVMRIQSEWVCVETSAVKVPE